MRNKKKGRRQTPTKNHGVRNPSIPIGAKINTKAATTNWGRAMEDHTRDDPQDGNPSIPTSLLMHSEFLRDLEPVI